MDDTRHLVIFLFEIEGTLLHVVKTSEEYLVLLVLPVGPVLGKWWNIFDIEFCDRIGNCVSEGYCRMNVLLFSIGGVLSIDVSCAKISECSLVGSGC